jgi:FkbM family methyltransferase
MLGSQSRILSSLTLDGQMLQLYPRRLAWHFIYKKYLLVLRDILLPFKEGKNKIQLFGCPYYYSSRFGIGFLQNVFVEDAILKEYIKPGATVIDVGGNIGQFHVFCISALQAGRVLSFEPLPNCFRLLEKNADEVYEGAVTCAKEVVLHYEGSTLTASGVAGVRGSHEVRAKGLRLDEHAEIKKLKKIDLLKIDTEGTEFDALKTAEGILAKVDYILIEVSTTRPNSGTVDEVVSYLAKQKTPFKIAATGVNYTGPDRKVEAFDLLFVREGVEK